MVHKSTCPCTSPCTCPCAHVCACPCTCCTYNTQRHMRSLSLRSPYRLTCFCSANAPGLPRPCSLYPCCPAHVVACRVPTLAAELTHSDARSRSLNPCPIHTLNPGLPFTLPNLAGLTLARTTLIPPAIVRSCCCSRCCSRRPCSHRLCSRRPCSRRPCSTHMDLRIQRGGSARAAACRAAHARTSMRGGGGGPHEQRKHCEMNRESMRIEKWPWRERCWRRGRQGRLRRTRWPCPRLCPENTFETGAQQV